MKCKYLRKSFVLQGERAAWDKFEPCQPATP